MKCGWKDAGACESSLGLSVWFSVGPDISTDQTNHNENSAGLITNGYGHRIWNGYCYGGKEQNYILADVKYIFYIKKDPPCCFWSI